MKDFILSEKPMQVGGVQAEINQLWSENRQLLHIIGMILNASNGKVIIDPSAVENYSKRIDEAEGKPPVIRLETLLDGSSKISDESRNS